MYRLSRQEMRIIEQTRREGEELQRQEKAAGTPARKGARAWSLLAFIVIFILFAFAVRLLVELLSD